MKPRFWLIVIIFVLIAQQAFSVTLSHLTVNNEKDFKRVILHFSGLFDYHYFELTNPYRLVIDLKNTKPVSVKSLTQYHGSVIKNIRVSVNKQQTRVVFDLTSHQYPVLYAVKPDRLYVDLYRSKTTRAKKEIASNKAIISVAELRKSAKYRPAVIVIDPGHGGKDPGATGPRGIHEKNVVLAIAKDLRADLWQFKTIKVAMTRTGDYFVTLRGRLAVARRDHANVFMAIHADSYKVKTASGASVFALSEHGATSEAARWLAHSENHAVLAGASFDTRSRAVRSVLLNLSQAVTIQNSLVFGSDVVHQLEKVTDMHSRTVDQARFVVLKSPDIPSLLVETGFISNPAEENRLANPHHQKALAHALMLGILTYLYQYPPHDSLVALQQAGRLVVKVKPGQTLSTIANQYWVTTTALKKYNHLKSNRLKIGQQLTVPPAKI